MRLRWLLAFVLNVSLLSIYSQPCIRFIQNEVVIGKVAGNAYPPVAYPFYNSGDAPLAILMVKKESDMKVNYPRTFINPGDSGIIYLHDEGNQIGTFSSEVLVFCNATGEQAKLVVKGERLSVLNCFPDPHNLLLREVHVIDSISKNPISGVQLTMIRNGEQSITGRTEKSGALKLELPIGMYAISVLAAGYPESHKSFFIPKSMPVIWLEISKGIVPELDPELVRVPVVPSVKLDSILPSDLYSNNNIVLLLDVSLSMRQEGKMELMKTASGMLVDALRASDRVSVIVYSDNASVLFEGISGDRKSEIMKKISKLETRGSTNGVKGLEVAYLIAERQFIPEGNNQVILATDGQFNAGKSSPDDLSTLVKNHSAKGMKLSVIGLGKQNLSLQVMEDMAVAGKGRFLNGAAVETDPAFLLDEIRTGSRKQGK
jgi:hypothetical protein